MESMMHPDPSPRDPLRPTEAEERAYWLSHGWVTPGLRAAYALALPRLIRLLVAEMPDAMMLTAADHESMRRQEDEAYSAGCEMGEVAEATRRSREARIATQRGDLTSDLLAAAARLTRER